jgi:hypothetical protein
LLCTSALGSWRIRRFSLRLRQATPRCTSRSQPLSCRSRLGGILRTYAFPTNCQSAKYSGSSMLTPQHIDILVYLLTDGHNILWFRGISAHRAASRRHTCRRPQSRRLTQATKGRSGVSWRSGFPGEERPRRPVRRRKRALMRLHPNPPYYRASRCAILACGWCQWGWIGQ